MTRGLGELAGRRFKPLRSAFDAQLAAERFCGESGLNLCRSLERLGAPAKPTRQ